MVLPAFQGRGLGSDAVRAVLSKARSEGRWDVVHAFPLGPRQGLAAGRAAQGRAQQVGGELEPDLPRSFPASRTQRDQACERLAARRPADPTLDPDTFTSAVMDMMWGGVRGSPSWRAVAGRDS
jgi:GNAT superfamily N-acetyltransferase